MANIKISELNEATLPLDGTEDLPIVDAGVTKRCSTQDIADLNGKIYHVLLQFNGTSNPTVYSELINNIGSISWVRTAEGTFYGNGPTGAFVENKTSTSRDTVINADDLYTKLYVNNSSQVALNARKISDNLPFDPSSVVMEVKITVYP